MTRPNRDQWLAWEVQEILVGCGLSQPGASTSGGPNSYSPKVVSLVRNNPEVYDPDVRGNPTTLTIRILPGQHPGKYAEYTATIAYNLGIETVKVRPIGPYLIRLDLWPDPTGGGELPSHRPGRSEGQPKRPEI